MNRPPADAGERGSASGAQPADVRAFPQGADAASGEDRLTCPTCGTQAPDGARSCPVCHRGLYRTCFCGWRLPANQRTCPNCGADWSQSARVARKSRSRTLKGRKVIRYAALGALTAAAAAVVIHLLLEGLARLAVNDAGAVPGGAAERLMLAAAGLASVARRAMALLVRHGQAIVTIIGIMVVGAGAGIALYLRKIGHHGKAKSRTSRRVRRKRRQ